MSFTERIKVVLDWDNAKGVTSLRQLRESVVDADTTVGKFKAGAGGALNIVKQHAAELAVAGGAALVAFGVKAVGAFTDTAKAAIDLGKATGLSTEEASRWIAVGDDYKVAAEDIQSGLKEIGKNLDADKWAKYGIATKDAAGKTRSSNDILLDTLDVLGKIPNETERVNAGNDLLGKGYKSLSPLVGQTRKEYEQMLAAVEDGQVITAKEAEKAERMRLAQDRLSDALREFTLAAGGAVASMAPWIDKLATAIEKVDTLGGLLKDGGGLERLANATTGAAGNTGKLSTAIEHLGLVTEDMRGQTAEAARWAGIAAEEQAKQAEATSEAEDALRRAAAATSESERETRRAAAATAELERQQQAQADATRAATKAHYDLIAAAKALQERELEAIDAKYGLEAANRRATEAAIAANEVLKDSTSSELARADAVEAGRQAAVSAALQFAEVNKQNEQGKGKIDLMVESLSVQAASLAPDSPLRKAIDEYIWQLKSIPTNLNTTIQATIVGTTGPIIPKSGAFASGTNSAPRGLGTVAEAGPEIVDLTNGVPVLFEGGEKVHTAEETRRMLNGRPSAGNTYVTVNSGLDERRVMAMLRGYARKGGRNPWQQ